MVYFLERSRINYKSLEIASYPRLNSISSFNWTVSSSASLAHQSNMSRLYRWYWFRRWVTKYIQTVPSPLTLSSPLSFRLKGQPLSVDIDLAHTFLSLDISTQPTFAVSSSTNPWSPSTFFLFEYSAVIHSSPLLSPFPTLHRPLRKFASTNNLAPHPTNLISDENPTRRRISHRLGLRVSPSKDSFFHTIPHRIAWRTLGLVDDAMGAKSLPHRDCDPLSPYVPSDEHPDEYSSTFDGSPHHQEQPSTPESMSTPMSAQISPLTQWNPEFNHSDEKILSKQYGVLKMEIISSKLRSGPGWGVQSIYVAYALPFTSANHRVPYWFIISLRMCLLSTVTSTENNSLPVVEPYYLSLFGGHSALSTIGIITNVRLHA